MLSFIRSSCACAYIHVRNYCCNLVLPDLRIHTRIFLFCFLIYSQNLPKRRTFRNIFYYLTLDKVQFLYERFNYCYFARTSFNIKSTIIIYHRDLADVIDLYKL